MGYLILNNTHGDDPLRVNLHPFQLTGQLRRLRGTSTTHHTHIEQVVTVIRIEVESWDVDNDTLALCCNRLVTTPAASLHIDNDATTIGTRRIFGKLLLQIEIGGVSRLHFV